MIGNKRDKVNYPIGSKQLINNTMKKGISASGLKIKESSQIIIKKKLVQNKIKPNSLSLDKRGAKESKKTKPEKLTNKKKESKLERKQIRQAIELSKKTARNYKKSDVKAWPPAGSDVDQTESDYAPNGRKVVKDS